MCKDIQEIIKNALAFLNKENKDMAKMTDQENEILKAAVSINVPKVSRKIYEIIIHCSDSPWGDVDIIRQWHTWPKDLSNGKVKYLGKTYKNREALPPEVQKLKGRGWSDIGYNYVITNGWPDYNSKKEEEWHAHYDGLISPGRKLNRIGAHCLGHNKNSIGICLIGKASDNYKVFGKVGFTLSQFNSLKSLIIASMMVYPIRFDHVYPHYEFSTKTCPCFNPYKLIVTPLEKTIKKFQKINGLTVDGIIGPNTRKKLDEIYG